MYIKKEKIKRLSKKTESRINWREEIVFNIFSSPKDFSEKNFSGIECDEGSSYDGALLLPFLLSEEEKNNIKIIFNKEVKDHYIEIRGKKYYYNFLRSLLKNENMGSLTLIMEESQISYFHSCDIREENKSFDGIPLGIWYDLLNSYPNLTNGTPASFLYSLFKLTQQQAVMSWNSKQGHLHHAGQRNILSEGGSAARSMLENVIALLKSQNTLII